MLLLATANKTQQRIQDVNGMSCWTVMKRDRGVPPTVSKMWGSLSRSQECEAWSGCRDEAWLLCSLLPQTGQAPNHPLLPRS